MNFLLFYAAMGVLTWVGAFIYFVREYVNLSIADLLEGLGVAFIFGCLWPIFLGAVSSETRIGKRVGQALEDWWTKPRWKV